MTVSKITDHVAQALALLKSQYGDATNLRAVVTALVDQVQDIEDDLYTMITSIVISSAVGVQLDRIGEWIGQARWDRSDADYRLLLEARVLANASPGTVERILTLVGTLISASLVYERIGTAHYQVAWDVSSSTAQATLDALGDLIEAATSAGVSWSLLETLTTITPALTFDVAGKGFDQGKFATKRVP